MATGVIKELLLFVLIFQDCSKSFITSIALSVASLMNWLQGERWKMILGNIFRKHYVVSVSYWKGCKRRVNDVKWGDSTLPCVVGIPDLLIGLLLVLLSCPGGSCTGALLEISVCWVVVGDGVCQFARLYLRSLPRPRGPHWLFLVG